MGKARNPNHMDNLKPFKKGKDERRNMDGAPKKIANLDKYIIELLGSDSEDAEGLKELLQSLYKQAVRKGNVRAAEILLERAFGKVTTKIDHTTDDKPFILKLNGTKSETD